MERFFRLCGEAGRINTDTLLHRYSSAAFEILKMSPAEAYPILKETVEGELNDKLYQLWLTFIPRMNKETYVGFGDFKDSVTGANIDNRSAEEILAEAKEIERRLRNGG